MIAKIETAVLVFGIVLIVAAIFLIIAVLMQQGKSHNISGTIAGGADTFFGKTKGQTISKKLSVFTSVVAIIFVLIVLAFYVQQTPNDYSSLKGEKTEDTTAVDTTAADAAESIADAIESEADAGESEAADAVESAADAVESEVDTLVEG